MAKKALPSWPADSLLFSGSADGRAAAEQLAAVLAIARRVSPADSKAFLRIADTARTLIRTLLTGCAAQRAMNARANRGAAERQRLLAELERLDARCLEAAKALPPDASGGFSRAARRFLLIKSRRLELLPADRRVIEPLCSLYARLKAQMKLSVDSWPLSAPAAEAALKNLDDPAVRRAAYGAFNAWYSEKAPLFADLLNAIAAARLNALERGGMTLSEATAADEGVTPEVLKALMSAVDEGAPAVRPAIALQAEAFASEAGPAGAGKLPVAFLWAPPPFQKVPAALSTFEGAVKTIKAALRPVAPDAADFIDREIAGGWIQARSPSGGEAGSWTDEVPSAWAVAVFADWQPTAGRAFELAHTLGEAYLRHALMEEPALVRRPPAVICETAGRLFSHALLAHLLSSGGDADERRVILWQGLNRLKKNLLDLPFRARLNRMIHEERARGYLTAPLLTDLTRRAWETYFGDATEGFDPFVWAHRVHFYRTGTIHYDWQYAFGFLASVPLLVRLRQDGRTASGGTLAHFCRDAAWLDARELFQKHLGEDIEDAAFWQRAHAASLRPLREAAEKP